MQGNQYDYEYQYQLISTVLIRVHAFLMYFFKQKCIYYDHYVVEILPRKVVFFFFFHSNKFTVQGRSKS